MMNFKIEGIMAIKDINTSLENFKKNLVIPDPKTREIHVITTEAKLNDLINNSYSVYRMISIYEDILDSLIKELIKCP